MQRSEGTRGGRGRTKTLVVALVVGAVVVLAIVLVASMGGDSGGFY